MNTVTMRGKEMNLAGNLPEIGDSIKDFKLQANDMSFKTAGDYKGKALIILTVPSLDTGVCDMEVRKFNSRAGSISDDLRLLTVSMDLPFAQSRWEGAAGVENVETLSDHLTGDFGRDYGVLMEDLRLLARAVFVYDKNGALVYKELVREVSSEPDYEKALEAARKAL